MNIRLGTASWQVAKPANVYFCASWANNSRGSSVRGGAAVPRETRAVGIAITIDPRPVQINQGGPASIREFGSPDY